MNAAAVAIETTAAVTFQEAENLYIYRSCKNLGAHSPLDVTGLTAKTSVATAGSRNRKWGEKIASLFLLPLVFLQDLPLGKSNWKPPS